MISPVLFERGRQIQPGLAAELDNDALAFLLLVDLQHVSSVNGSK